MNKKLKEFSELVAKANDSLTGQHSDINTIMGITDKTLRQQGIQADAITIECAALNKKIVMLLHDGKPDIVGVAFGNKDGDITSSKEHALADMSEVYVVGVMKEYFTA